MIAKATEIPRSVESEKSLIAAVLIDPRVLDKIEHTVGRYDFFDDSFGKVFAVLQDLRAAGKPADSGIVIDALHGAGLIAALGGVTGIRELYQQDFQAAHAVYYAREIAKASALRRQIWIGEEMARRAGAELKPDPADVRSWAETQLEGTASALEANVRAAHEIATEYVEEMIRESREGLKPGVMTGFFSLDASIGSLMRSELIIVAARPNVGKTAFVMQIAEHCALKGKNVLVVSLEMKDRELIGRLLAKHSKVNSRVMRARMLNDEDQHTLRVTAAAMDAMAIRVWSPAQATLPQIRAVARLEQSRTKLDLVVVDYIGLVAQESTLRTERHLHIGRVSSGLKSLAKELDVPVLVACQLNRDAEGQRPTLNQLRDSGSIEQDADVVMLLHRETRDATAAEIHVAKHRNSECGSITLEFCGATTSFSDPNEPQPTNAFTEWNMGF